MVLLHGSPGNARLVKPLAERLASDFSVYAIDTPGFGDSDDLGSAIESVGQLADAYRGILDSLGLDTVLLYGTHSGAAIGLELARRHPARIRGFVLEGVPAFTAGEMRPLLAPEYLAAFEPDILGGHYSRTWTRFHDQFVWFPWYQRDSRHLNEASAGSAADIHLWVDMYFQAARHDYRPVYRTIIAYGGEAIEAARVVRAPGVFLAEQSDMLFPHLDRLPPLGAGQRIERVESVAEVPARVEAALRALAVGATPAVEASPVVGASPAVAPRASAATQEYFHDLPGGQILVRSRGHGAGTAVLLLHDAPGGGRPLLELHRALSAERTVLLPDLPCCGESDPLPEEGAAGAAPPALGEYADVLAGLLAARVGCPLHVHGIGVGAALALELNARHPELVRALSITGLLRLPAAARRDMIGRLAPRIVLADDGSHWYRAWLMLRDSLVRWPWYDRQPSALRRQSIVLEPASLHAWSCDLMRQWHSYHRIIDAMLDWDVEAPIDRASGKLTIALDPEHALYRSDLDWSRTGIDGVDMTGGPAERARIIAKLAG